jgi:hypothetical protein
MDQTCRATIQHAEKERRPDNARCQGEQSKIQMREDGSRQETPDADRA